MSKCIRQGIQFRVNSAYIQHRKMQPGIHIHAKSPGYPGVLPFYFTGHQNMHFEDWEEVS